MERDDEHRVPDVTDGHTVPPTHSRLNGLSTQETETMNFHEQPKTPPTVVKRKKPVNTSKFNQTDRKSKNCATFYFRHHDTDSDGRQMIETDEKSQESSEEEWTYVGNPKIANEDSTDVMTSSVEIQCELPLDVKKEKPPSPKPKLESTTPDLIKVDARCRDIERLVIQAEELVQKQAQHQMAKKKSSRSFKPLMLDDEGKTVGRVKMSRIKEWLHQSTEGERVKNDSNQCTESYDASGEYTTESEVDTSLTSEERNLHSSMDMSTSTCTVTPTHQAKVQLRKKRGGPRPWSVSCLSQLPAARDAITHAMSISESALNTLASPQRVTSSGSSSKLRGSSTTVQGHVSSTNTMTEACTSCVEANDKQCWLRRKRFKLRKHNSSDRRDRLVKSLSFCGRLSPEIEDKNERSAASDPATSRKNRFDTTSTSGNDSDEELIKQQLATIAHLRRSIEKTHITTNEPDSAILEQNEAETVVPSFKLGPEGGTVRPRLNRSTEREKSFLALSLGDPSQLWDLCIDKDSDVDKSVTAGTEEHSSFSEQAWDFYQEKYNSEPYSEAPDSDAARRLLEFGDDYRAYLDSQSDCCSSLSAQPEQDPSPTGTRRRRPPSEMSRERSLPRYKRPSRTSPVDTPFRKPKKSITSAERKKILLDSLEKSRNSVESNESRRRKPSESERKNKRSPEFDLLNIQALSRRRHSSNLTSDEVNSSLEYTEANNRPDILDSLNRRRKNTDKDGESELQKVALSELRRRSTEGADSEESSSPKKHSRRNWEVDSDSEEEVRSLIRRSSTQLEVAEAAMASQDSSPDLLRAFDYTEIVTRCRENINLLDAALADGSVLSSALQRDIRAVSARWSALRAAALRRGGARRLRREIAALRETLDDVCEPDDCAPQPHTRVQLNRRIDELKERLSRLLECKVAMLKLTVSVRRTLGEVGSDDGGLTEDLSMLLAAWDDAHQRTSNELLSLEKAVSAWAEWESALRELQGALRGDMATLQTLKDRGGDQPDVAKQIRQLAASLIDKKKGGSTCDSLSDSGISDGDSEAAGGRARRLCALRELARRLQAALAPASPAHRAIAKRMEQTENEVKTLQESCRALVEQSIPDLKIDNDTEPINAVAGNKTGSGDPDYSPRSGWVWRVIRSSLPIQLCLVALLLAAWLVERPRCCDALNSLAQTLTPQLRYVRGPPPV